MKRLLLGLFAVPILGLGTCLSTGCMASSGHNSLLKIRFGTEFAIETDTKETTDKVAWSKLEVPSVEEWLFGTKPEPVAEEPKDETP